MLDGDLSQNRYHRQQLLPGIGPEGQGRLRASRVLLVGCGGLGTVIAEYLVRAGVGMLRIADRDIVELSDLQRQTLFDQNDVRRQLPKSVAAAKRLRQVNSDVLVEPHVIDVQADNIRTLADAHGQRRPVDLVIDGTDNAETRYLINDLAVEYGIPWIYGGVVGTEGRVMPIRPGQGPCLRCIFPHPPGPGQLPTCSTAGVLGPAVGAVACLQTAIAIKLLTGNSSAVADELLTLDLWSGHIARLSLAGARRADCPACGLKSLEFLHAPSGTRALALCGRNAVQIRPAASTALDLTSLAARLAGAGSVQSTPYFLRCTLHDPAGIVLTAFPDGRLIVQGTDDPGRAKAIAARFVSQ